MRCLVISNDDITHAGIIYNDNGIQYVNMKVSLIAGLHVAIANN